MSFLVCFYLPKLLPPDRDGVAVRDGADELLLLVGELTRGVTLVWVFCLWGVTFGRVTTLPVLLGELLFPVLNVLAGCAVLPMLGIVARWKPSPEGRFKLPLTLKVGELELPLLPVDGLPLKPGRLVPPLLGLSLSPNLLLGREPPNEGLDGRFPTDGLCPGRFPSKRPPGR